METLQNNYQLKKSSYLNYLYNFKDIKTNSVPTEMNRKLDELWANNNTPVYETRMKKYAVLSNFHLENI